MNLKVSFSWVGLVVFALPMLINLAYAAFPPAGKAEPPTPVTRWVELVEQSSRIAYLLAVMLLVSREPVRPQGVWFWLAVCFLALYYAVWIRYFLGGREIALLQRAFLLFPLDKAPCFAKHTLCRQLWGCGKGFTALADAGVGYKGEHAEKTVFIEAVFLKCPREAQRHDPIAVIERQAFANVDNAFGVVNA